MQRKSDLFLRIALIIGDALMLILSSLSCVLNVKVQGKAVPSDCFNKKVENL